MEGFNNIATVMTDVCKKTQPAKVVLTTACQEGFAQVKRLLSATLALAGPNFDKMFELCTDSSSTGLGASLMQAGKGNKKHPIAFFK